MIREAILKAINLRKVKQKELAEQIGITPASLSQYLSGVKEMKTVNVEKAFKALDIKIMIDLNDKQ